MAIGELIDRLFALSAGLAFAGALFGGVLWRDAVRWRYLAKHYGGAWRQPVEKQTMRSAVLYGLLPAYKSYAGILTVGANQTGLSLRVMAPFSLFHQPLFIPFADISGWRQTWYLDSKSIELSFRRAPDVKMVMPAAQVEWIQSFAGGQLSVRHERSPHEAKPTGWYVFVIVQSAVILSGLAWLILSGRLTAMSVN